MSQQADEIRRDTVDVLRDVLRWRLTLAQWDEVIEILAPLEIPLDLADPECLAALTRVSVALELAGPQLLTPIDKEASPAPDFVRDRANTLIGNLAQPVWAGDDEASKATE